MLNLLKMITKWYSDVNRSSHLFRWRATLLSILYLLITLSVVQAHVNDPYCPASTVTAPADLGCIANANTLSAMVRMNDASVFVGGNITNNTYNRVLKLMPDGGVDIRWLSKAGVTMFGSNPPYLTGENISKVYCRTGSSFTVPFTTDQTFTGSNSVLVELSDADGIFDSPTIIGSLTTNDPSGNITVTVPVNTPEGTGYRMRLVATNPVFIGADNGFDIAIGDYCPANLDVIPLLWLRADQGISLEDGNVRLWEDRSGRANDNSQSNTIHQPAYTLSAANFNPAVEFYGNQWVADADGILDPAVQYSSAQVFLAHNSRTPQPLNGRGLYGQYVRDSDNTIGRFMGHGEFFGTQYFGVNVTGLGAWVQLPAGPERLNAFVLNTFSAKPGQQDLWFNGGDNQNDPFQNKTFTTTGDVPWATGAAPEGNDLANKRPFSFTQNGFISELIVYGESLNESSRLKLESYLAIKYGSQLLHNYFKSSFNGDNEATTTVYDMATYGNNIAGIARDDNYRLFQKQSRSQNSVPYAGMVTMGLGAIEETNALNMAALPDTTYLVWGDDNGAVTELDLPGGKKGLARKWKLQATGQSAGTPEKPRVQVQFDLSGVTLEAATYDAMKLMIDRDGDGDFSTGTVDEYEATPGATQGSIIFDDVVWDTDNNGVDVFSLATNSCAAPSDAGEIAGSQSICPNTTAAPLTNVTAASGQSGNVVYRWQQSLSSSSTGFSDIADSDSEGFSPGLVAQTTWYRRLANADCLSDWETAIASNVIQVSAIDTIPPAITCNNVTVRFNGDQTTTLQVADLAQATDFCGVEGIQLTTTQVSCAQLGQVIPVIAVATDVNGNTNFCTSQVTVSGLPCGWRHNNGSLGDCASDIDYAPQTGVWTANATNCRNNSPFQADKLMFAQYTLCGDGSITAQVTGLSGAQPFAGITMRESNDVGSKKVQMTINRISNIVRREIRMSTGGQAFPMDFSSPCERTWLRMVRTGNMFRGYTSQDGITWWYVMNVHVPMNACLEIGLVLTNMQQQIQGTATFANVSVTGGGSGPSLLNTGEILSLEDDAALDVRVFPNPTDGLLNVEVTNYPGDRLQLSLYDMNGQLKLQRNGVSLDGPITMDVSALPAGVYQLHIGSEELPQLSRRIVITK
jgi:hypothetical protein